MTLSVFAPAKVNLSLAVGRPMADGRHPLVSLAAFATVGDTLRLEPADRLTLQVTGPFAASLEAEADNLVVRAARALMAAAGRQQRGAALTLEKNLPVASGIGGGSADAAAALRGLNALWGLGFDDESLAEVATTLGADVPVCVRCVPALMQGTGETVTAFAMPRLDAVLVNPGVPAATGAVYKRFDALALGAAFEPATDLPRWETASQALRALAGLGNDLTAPATDVAPAIADVMERLRQDPRAQIVRLSGSGATVFALAEGGAAARAIAQDLAAEDRGWWIAPVQLGAVDAHARAV